MSLLIHIHLEIVPRKGAKWIHAQGRLIVKSCLEFYIKLGWSSVLHMIYISISIFLHRSGRSGEKGRKIRAEQRWYSVPWRCCSCYSFSCHALSLDHHSRSFLIMLYLSRSFSAYLIVFFLPFHEAKMLLHKSHPLYNNFRCNSSLFPETLDRKRVGEKFKMPRLSQLKHSVDGLFRKLNPLCWQIFSFPFAASSDSSSAQQLFNRAHNA